MRVWSRRQVSSGPPWPPTRPSGPLSYASLSRARFLPRLRQVHDERVNSLAKRLGVDAQALVAANRAYVRGISTTSLLWQETVLLLPAPTATAASVNAVLERWLVVERALRLQARAQREADCAARVSALTGKKRPAELMDLVDKPQLNGPKPQLAPKPQLGTRAASATLLAPTAYAKRPKGYGTPKGDTGSAAALAKPKLPLAQSLSLSGLDGATKRSAADARGARDHLDDFNEIEDGPRRLRIMLSTPGQPGSQSEQRAQCIGTVEVLAGMTLFELAKSISTDLDVQPGFQLVIGALRPRAREHPEHKVARMRACSSPRRLCARVPRVVLPTRPRRRHPDSRVALCKASAPIRRGCGQRDHLVRDDGGAPLGLGALHAEQDPRAVRCRVRARRRDFGRRRRPGGLGDQDGRLCDV